MMNHHHQEEGDIDMVQNYVQEQQSHRTSNNVLNRMMANDTEMQQQPPRPRNPSNNDNDDDFKYISNTSNHSAGSSSNDRNNTIHNNSVGFKPIKSTQLSATFQATSSGGDSSSGNESGSNNDSFNMSNKNNNKRSGNYLLFGSQESDSDLSGSGSSDNFLSMMNPSSNSSTSGFSTSAGSSTGGASSSGGVGSIISGDESAYQDALHPFWLTFDDDEIEEKYNDFLYVSSGFVGGKLYIVSALVILIGSFLVFYKDGPSKEMFSDKYWIPMDIAFAANILMAIAIFIEPMHAYREWFYLGVVFSHWPGFTVMVFLGKEPEHYRYAYITGCYFFCTFAAQPRFSRVFLFLTLVPLITLIGLTSANSYWDRHTPIEVLYWPLVLIPLFCLRMFERKSRIAFIAGERAKETVDFLEERIAISRAVVSKLFPPTATLDFLLPTKNQKEDYERQQQQQLGNTSIAVPNNDNDDDEKDNPKRASATLDLASPTIPKNLPSSMPAFNDTNSSTQLQLQQRPHPHTGLIPPRSYNDVACVITDVVNFTKWSSSTTPQGFVKFLSKMFVFMDDAALHNDVEKLYTVGDSFVGAVIDPEILPAQRALCAVKFGLDVQISIDEWNAANRSINASPLLKKKKREGSGDRKKKSSKNGRRDDMDGDDDDEEENFIINDEDDNEDAEPGKTSVKSGDDPQVSPSSSSSPTKKKKKAKFVGEESSGADAGDEMIDEVFAEDGSDENLNNDDNKSSNNKTKTIRKRRKKKRSSNNNNNDPNGLNFFDDDDIDPLAARARKKRQEERESGQNGERTNSNKNQYPHPKKERNAFSTNNNNSSTVLDGNDDDEHFHQLRVGVAIGSGTCVFVGTNPPRFDLFGEVMEEAKALEGACSPGAVNISQTVMLMLESIGYRVHQIEKKVVENGTAEGGNDDDHNMTSNNNIHGDNNSHDANPQQIAKKSAAELLDTSMNFTPGLAVATKQGKKKEDRNSNKNNSSVNNHDINKEDTSDSTIEDKSAVGRVIQRSGYEESTVSSSSKKSRSVNSLRSGSASHRSNLLSTMNSSVTSSFNAHALSAQQQQLKQFKKEEHLYRRRIKHCTNIQGVFKFAITELVSNQNNNVNSYCSSDDDDDDDRVGVFTKKATKEIMQKNQGFVPASAVSEQEHEEDRRKANELMKYHDEKEEEVRADDIQNNKAKAQKKSRRDRIFEKIAAGGGEHNNTNNTHHSNMMTMGGSLRLPEPSRLPSSQMLTEDQIKDVCDSVVALCQRGSESNSKKKPKQRQDSTTSLANPNTPNSNNQVMSNNSSFHNQQQRQQQQTDTNSKNGGDTLSLTNIAEQITSKQESDRNAGKSITVHTSASSPEVGTSKGDIYSPEKTKHHNSDPDAESLFGESDSINNNINRSSSNDTSLMKSSGAAGGGLNSSSITINNNNQNNNNSGGAEKPNLEFSKLFLKFEDDRVERAFFKSLRRSQFAKGPLYLMIVYQAAHIGISTVIGCNDTTLDRMMTFVAMVLLALFLVHLVYQGVTSMTKWWTIVCFYTPFLLISLTINGNCRHPKYASDIVVTYVQIACLAFVFTLETELKWRCVVVTIMASTIWMIGAIRQAIYEGDKVLVIAEIMPAVGFVSYSIDSYFCDFALRTSFQQRMGFHFFVTSASGRAAQTAHDMLGAMLPSFVSSALLATFDTDGSTVNGSQHSLSTMMTKTTSVSTTLAPSLRLKNLGFRMKQSIWEFPTLCVIFVSFDEHLLIRGREDEMMMKNNNNIKINNNNNQNSANNQVGDEQSDSTTSSDVNEEEIRKLNEARACEIQRVANFFELFAKRYKVMKIKTFGNTSLWVAGIDMGATSLSTSTSARAMRHHSKQQMQDGGGASTNNFGPGGGVSTTHPSDHAVASVKAALAMVNSVPNSAARAGIHVGRCNGALFGQESLVFDVFGSTVNIASRLSTNAIRGQVLMSKEAASLVQMRVGVMAASEVFALQPVPSLNLKGVGNFDVMEAVLK